MPTQPLSNRRSGSQQARGCLLPFFALFFLAGCGIFYVALLRPGREYLASRSWQETTCTVLESRVAEHPDSDGDTYSIEVAYTYSFGGRGYRSDRFGFLKTSSSGYDGKARKVARYPSDSRVPCWVDPLHPEQAVLDRELSWEWLIGLLPLAFIAVGGGGMVWAVRFRREAKARATAFPLDSATPFGVEPPPATTTGGPLELRPAVSPGGKLAGLIFISLFWNGIVSIFLFQVVKTWRAGEPNGCMTVFLIPFVLIGIAMVFGTFRQLLVLFNPRPRLTLDPGAPRLGETAYLQWSLAGRASRVRRLSVVLQGREEAQYRRGTDTHTDRETFATLTVIDTGEPFTIANGSASFGVPADTVPSFKAEHNKIVWSLKVTCDIPGWPDSEEEYEVVVRPEGAF
jgi:hypothetical protein